MAQAAQRSRVAVYSFDAVGIRGYEGRTMQFAPNHGSLNSLLIQSNLRGGLQYVADETGGRYIANENDAGLALRQMSEQFSSYYSIGVQPRRGARGTIEVKVKNRPELRVYAARRRAPLTLDQELEQNVRARLYTRHESNPLGASLAIVRPVLVDGQCVVKVQVQAAPPAVGPELTSPALDLYFVMLNERADESEVRRSSVPLDSGRLAHSMMLRVQPRPHVLSLALANPLSGEASYLQGEIDGTACR